MWVALSKGEARRGKTKKEGKIKSVVNMFSFSTQYLLNIHFVNDSYSDATFGKLTMQGNFSSTGKNPAGIQLPGDIQNKI